jgi:hypothetical protein
MSILDVVKDDNLQLKHKCGYLKLLGIVVGVCVLLYVVVAMAIMAFA